jgi:hypothetical protein
MRLGVAFCIWDKRRAMFISVPLRAKNVVIWLLPVTITVKVTPVMTLCIYIDGSPGLVVAAVMQRMGRCLLSEWHAHVHAQIYSINDTLLILMKVGKNFLYTTCVCIL